MLVRLAAAACLNLHRNRNLPALDLFPYLLQKPRCDLIVTAQQAHTLGHPSQVARGKTEPTAVCPCG